MLNLNEASEYLKVSKSTLRRWESNGIITSIRTNGNHRRYDIIELNRCINTKIIESKIVCGYCRVSTVGQKDDLSRQQQIIESYCASKGYNFKIISDIGSGLNYNKKGLIELIKLVLDKKITKIVINYKDRLIRFGFEIFKEICDHNDVEIEIINHTENATYETELVDDVLSLITVFSSKLYGSRSHKNKKVIEENKKLFNKDV